MIRLRLPILCRSFLADTLSVFSCRYSDGLFALVDSLDRTLGAVATYTAATASSDSSTRDGGEKRIGIRFSDRIRLPFGSFRADALSVFSCRISDGLFLPYL